MSISNIGIARRNKMEKIGEFEVVSGVMRISDPCYDRNTWCADKVPVVLGTWNAYVSMVDKRDWGRRVSMLTVAHKDLLFREFVFDEVTGVGVDSGQCGFFDEQYYQDNSLVHRHKRIREEWLVEEEPWYSMCCDITLTKDAGVIPFGAVSRSGFGDGMYIVEGHENEEGCYNLLRLIFIDKEE
jgi:hypothetical protein